MLHIKINTLLLCFRVELIRLLSVMQYLQFAHFSGKVKYVSFGCWITDAKYCLHFSLKATAVIKMTVTQFTGFLAV